MAIRSGSLISEAASPLLEPGRIGAVDIRNRLVRAGTSETMAGLDGSVTDDLVALYETLARNASV